MEPMAFRLCAMIYLELQKYLRGPEEPDVAFTYKSLAVCYFDSECQMKHFLDRNCHRMPQFPRCPSLATPSSGWAGKFALYLHQNLHANISKTVQLSPMELEHNLQVLCA